MSFWKLVTLIFWLAGVLAMAFAADARTVTGLVIHLAAVLVFIGVAVWAERTARALDRDMKTEETFR